MKPFNSLAATMSAAGLFSLWGCGTPARPIETGGTESITSIDDVDMQDINKAASGMLESLLVQGTLSGGKNKPAQLVIGTIVNDTSSRFDVGEMTYRMREQLVNSGQAAVVTTYGNNPEDATAQDAAKREAFLKGQTSVPGVDPDFSLTGKITQVKREAGNVRQATYTFRLTLTNLRTGLEAWTKVVDVTKQGTKNAIGF